MTQVVVIVNPSAASGRAGRSLGAIRAASSSVFPESTVEVTTGVGHGMQLAERAARGGAGLVIAVGGDGTMHEICNGVVRSGQRGCAVGHVSLGTGGDFAKMFPEGSDIEHSFMGLKHGTKTAVDIMAVHCEADNGEPAERYALNVVGAGMAGDVVHRVNNGPKWLGGRLAFLWGTVTALLNWPSPNVEIEWTDVEGNPGRWCGALSNAFIANGRFCGGGMIVAPDASLEDGRLRLVIVPDRPALVVLRHLPYLYNGRIDDVPWLMTHWVRSVDVKPLGAGRLRAESDGESPGWMPVSVSCLHRRLSLMIPRFSPGLSLSE